MHFGSHFAELFQLSYITRDIDQAVDEAARELGVPASTFHVGDAEAPVLSGGKVQDLKLKAAIANIGRHQFEILQPISGPIHVYTDFVDLDSKLLNFHHVALAVRGPFGNFQKVVEQVRASGDEIAFLHPPADDPNPMVAFCYVNTRPRVGHHTEYLWWAPEMVGQPSIPNLDA
jgi:hypothetical protein